MILKTKPIRLKGAALEALRREVFARDTYQCRFPIIGGEWNVLSHQCLRIVSWESGHLCHRKSRGAGGPDTAENTFTGCAECHSRQHTEGFNGKPCKKKER